MTHDPMCQKANVMEIRFGNVCSQCDLIAKVREDERQKAHNVIDRFDMFSDDRDAMHAWINGTPPDWWTGERS